MKQIFITWLFFIIILCIIGSFSNRESVVVTKSNVDSLKIDSLEAELYSIQRVNASNEILIDNYREYIKDNLIANKIFFYVKSYSCRERNN